MSTDDPRAADWREPPTRAVIAVTFVPESGPPVTWRLEGEAGLVALATDDGWFWCVSATGHGPIVRG